MGTKNDMATREKKPREDTPWLRMCLERVRDWIFRRGLAPEGKAVENVLGKTSTSPSQVCLLVLLCEFVHVLMLHIQSAFSSRLAAFGFDIYRALVPDIMHEFELGVWKATLTHLIRILTSIGPSVVIKLNARYVFTTSSFRLLIDFCLSGMWRYRRLEEQPFANSEQTWRLSRRWQRGTSRT